MCKNPQCNCMLLFLHNPIFSTTTNCIGVHSISESTTQAVPVSHSPNQSPVIFSKVTSQKKLLITSTSPFKSPNQFEYYLTRNSMAIHVVHDRGRGYLNSFTLCRGGTLSPQHSIHPSGTAPNNHTQYADNLSKPFTYIP
jgi:hypothetical protein